MKMKEIKKTDKYLDRVKELKKALEYEGVRDTNFIWYLEGSRKAWQRDWLKWKSEEESSPYRQQNCWDQLEYWEESCNLRRLAVIQTSVK